MPLQEGVGFDEIVSILTTYYLDRKQVLRDTYGQQAPMLADEMGDMLGAIFQNETPYGQLWLEYVQNPRANEAEVIGALEVLDESVPEVTIRLQGYYAGFLQMLEDQGELIETGQPEPTIDEEQITAVKSTDDMDDDDEYREDNTYLRGNVEDRSTSALYYEGLSTSIEPNETESTSAAYTEGEETSFESDQPDEE